MFLVAPLVALSGLCLVARWVALLVARSVVRSVARSVARWVARWVARFVARLLALLVACWLVSWVAPGVAPWVLSSLGFRLLRNRTQGLVLFLTRRSVHFLLSLPRERFLSW